LVFYSHGGMHENSTLESIDPGGRQWRELGPERAIGCIVYPATEIVAPGVVKHVYGNQFPLGEPSGEISEDVTRLSELFTAAGMKARCSTASVTRSGSSSGATSVSIRSAR
jgi:2-dehydropantoate 2-reductase